MTSDGPGPSMYALGRWGRADDPEGHGTHVAGSVLGGLPSDLHDPFDPPYLDDGARIHTGADHNDDGVIDSGQIRSQAAAKNCVTVGASESSRPDLPLTYGQGRPQLCPGDPINSDPIANNPRDMAAFSSRGPTRERRVKPDVVAPGTCVLSTSSRATAPSSTSFGKSPDTGMFFDTGTSTATPRVAGRVAVVREALTNVATVSRPHVSVAALVPNDPIPVTVQPTP